MPAVSSVSSSRSDCSMEVNTPVNGHQSNLPTEPWQVTRRHLNLTVEEMASLPGSEMTCSPEEMNAKILKVSMRKPFVLKYFHSFISY